MNKLVSAEHSFMEDDNFRKKKKTCFPLMHFRNACLAFLVTPTTSSPLPKICCLMTIDNKGFVVQKHQTEIPCCFEPKRNPS